MIKNRFSWLLWAGIYLLVTGWFWLAYHSLTLGVEWAAWLYPEDHFFENLGAVSLFLAAGFFFYAFVHARRAGRAAQRVGLYLGLSVLFLIAAGAEIGWGQRLLNPAGTDTAPAPITQQKTASDNQTGAEVNPLLRPENLLILVMVGLSVGVPIAWLAIPGLRGAGGGQFPAALLGMGPLFLLNQIFGMYASGHFKPWYRYKIVRFPQALQEIKESNFELLCLLLALVAVWELSRYLKRRGALQETHSRQS